MFKLLLKKQISEVFKEYFFDHKRNRKRSKGWVIAYFVFFVVIMVGVLGGMFTGLSALLAPGLSAAGMGWLFFTIMTMISIVLGAFGSIFNTFTGLYLSKDNDMLLSMPIPPKTIIAARLANVFLLGTMYSAVVIVPAIVVYWIVAGINVVTVVSGILLLLDISAFVLVLSCLLGWAVAKISLKLKNKSFVKVFLALFFIGVYYFFYFRANSMISDLLMNASVYGNRIKGSAYILYLLGSVGTGDIKATVIITLASALLLGLTAFILSRTFISIATASGKTERIKYREKRAKEKSVFGAFLSKELSRFTSSPTYMLNTGLGILLIPVVGVVLLIKGSLVFETLQAVFSAKPGSGGMLLCVALCMLTSMNDMAAPSVSLEGKSIWIPQSLPVAPKMVLRAKLSMHLVLTVIPMLFAVICTAFVVPGTPLEKLLICLLPLIYAVFSAFFAMFFGVNMANLRWTNEVVPVKQGGAVVVSLFGNWGVTAVFAVPFFVIGYKLGIVLYLGIWAAVFAVLSILILHWLDTKGSERFGKL